MKLMMVAPYFYPRIGGMENYAYNITRLLAEKYDVSTSVICSNWERQSYREDMIGNTKVYRLPYLFKISSTPVNPFWHNTISSIILEERPEIINGHMPVPYIADIACIAAYKEKIPFILTYQNDLVGRNMLLKLLSGFYYYWSGIKTLRLSQKIIITSENYAKSSPYLRDFKSKLEIVPPGVDVRKMRTDRKVKSSKQVLFVGQLNRASQHKGLNYLIRSMKMVTEAIKDARLVVVGTGDYIHHHRNMAIACGVQDKIDFVGFIRDEELPEYYGESSVVVLPSYNRAEGFGIVLLEAQACGTPVIGTSVGGIPGALKDGKTGLLVPPGDPERLAEAIIRILKDDTLARQLGCNGHNWVTQELTWEKSAQKTLRIFQEAITTYPRNNQV